MTPSNLWADLAASYLRTRAAHGDHEAAKAELKKLVSGVEVVEMKPGETIS